MKWYFHVHNKVDSNQVCSWESDIWQQKLYFLESGKLRGLTQSCHAFIMTVLTNIYGIRLIEQLRGKLMAFYTFASTVDHRSKSCNFLEDLWHSLWYFATSGSNFDGACKTVSLAVDLFRQGTKTKLSVVLSPNDDSSFLKTCYWPVYTLNLLQQTSRKNNGRCFLDCYRQSIEYQLIWESRDFTRFSTHTYLRIQYNNCAFINHCH